MEVVITDMDYEVDYFEGKTRKILVLGSGGQVGAYLTEYLRCVLMLKSWSLILLMVLIRT